MKKGWKWVIGIVIALVIIAALVAGAFLMRARFGNLAIAGYPNRQIPGFDDRGNGWNYRYPGMMPFGMHDLAGRGRMGFGWMIFGGLIRGLFSLGILALAVMGVIWLVNRLRKPATRSAVIEPAAAPVAVVSESATPASEPVEAVAGVSPCPKCGEPVQESWKHCPNCGKKLK